MKRKTCVAAAIATIGIASQAGAVVISFTGGTVYQHGGGTGSTNNSAVYDNVSYYEEGGFRLEILGGAGEPFSGLVGDYYGVGNDVIHAHWDAGDVAGTATLIRVTKIDNTPFDLNYFVLTSNTDTGGWVASGNERAFIRNNNGNDLQLPVEDWGLPGSTQIFLPASYDGITSFEFYVQSDVDCFGMDEFFIDEPPPPPNGVPDGAATLPLLGLSLTVLGGLKAKKRAGISA